MVQSRENKKIHEIVGKKKPMSVLILYFFRGERFVYYSADGIFKGLRTVRL